jgi:hypothetical protein
MVQTSWKSSRRRSGYEVSGTACANWARLRIKEPLTDEKHIARHEVASREPGELSRA